MKDYYKILNVEKTAKLIAIKKAFRKLVKEKHPDVNKSKNAHINFVEINEAYQVLSNPIKRIQYDRLYDFKILNKRPENQKKYHRKHEKWERNVEKTARKGQNKSSKQNKIKEKSFFKLFIEWVFEQIFGGILEGIFRVILEIIFSI